MHRCRTKREFGEGTWISDEMEEAYLRLHQAGYAVSVEVMEDGTIIQHRQFVSNFSTFKTEIRYI